MNPIEVENMDVLTFNTYYKCIEPLQAREFICDIESSSFPHRKPSTQTSAKKKIHRQAYPEMHQQKPLSSEDVAEFLKRKL